MVGKYNQLPQNTDTYYSHCTMYNSQNAYWIQIWKSSFLKITHIKTKHRCHTVVRPESPANLSTNLLIPGIFKKVPSTGTLRKKLMATGKNPLNSNTKPYVSSSMPTMGHPASTMMIPPKNAIDALTLCFWKKNLNVRSNPITHDNPAMNKIFPSASRLLSNNISIPMKRKNMPKPARPTPIFCVSVISNMFENQELQYLIKNEMYFHNLTPRHNKWFAGY